MALHSPNRFSSFNPSSEAPGPPSHGPRADASPHLNVSLVLKTVIGTTASSPNGFVCVPRASLYATCVGSAAVVNYLDKAFNVKQTVFRVLPEHCGPSANGSSTQITAPSTPEPRSRTRAFPASQSRPASMCLVETTSSPGKASLRARSKSVTCVACSSDGRLLAVGEASLATLVKLAGTDLHQPDRLLSEDPTVLCIR